MIAMVKKDNVLIDSSRLCHKKEVMIDMLISKNGWIN